MISPRVTVRGHKLTVTAAAAIVLLLATGCDAGATGESGQGPQGLPYEACDGVVPDEVIMQVTGRNRDGLELHHRSGFRDSFVGWCMISDGKARIMEVGIETTSSALFDGRRARILADRGEGAPMPDSWVNTSADRPAYSGEWLIHRSDDDPDAADSHLLYVSVSDAPEGHDAMADAMLVLEHLADFYENFTPRDPRGETGST